MLICQEILNSPEDLKSFDCMETKYKLLNKCAETLNHRVPNSLMHKISNIGMYRIEFLSIIQSIA